MAFDFPSSPTEGQEFTPPGGPTYAFNSPSWKVKASTSSYVNKTGDTMTGQLTVPGLLTKGTTHAVITADTGAAGMNSGYWFYDQGKLRWAFYKHGVAESGSNAGSDLRLDRYADNEASLGNALVFSRASGLITLGAGQLKFPATANLSSDVNTLDDYKEGSWVPDLKFGGASVGLTYSLQRGNYTKVGNLVTCGAEFGLSAKGTSTGNATILGLPYPVTGVIPAYWGELHPAVWPAGATGIGAYVTASTMTLFYGNAAGIGIATDAHFGASSTFRMGFSYFTP